MRLKVSTLLVLFVAACGVPAFGAQDGALKGKWVAESTGKPNASRMFPQPWGVEFTVITDGAELTMETAGGKRVAYELNGKVIKTTSNAYGIVSVQFLKAIRSGESIVIELQSGEYTSTVTLRLSGSRLSITQSGPSPQLVISATYLRADKGF